MQHERKLTARIADAPLRTIRLTVVRDLNRVAQPFPGGDITDVIAVLLGLDVDIFVGAESLCRTIVRQGIVLKPATT